MEDREGYRPWFYFVPINPDGSHQCGTGCYFESYQDAVKWALGYDRRTIKHRVHKLTCQILNVHHEVIGVVGLTFGLQRVRLNQGGYDDTGYYWGVDMPLYYYAEWETGEPCGHIRAYDRADAKTQIRAKYPGAQFWR